MITYKIVTSSNANSLTEKVNQAISEGWEIIGSHHVVEKHHQLRYSGMQHKDTTIDLEYSQTIIFKS
jgi:hypothetical protein